jgi:non-specific serine/threonine protein kinase/serine/threonine-protein kinase
MSAERWDTIKRVFQDALERSPEERKGFIREACADDVELQREVEALLRAQRAAGDFLSGPAMTFPEPADLQGRRIGPYRILERAGQGGMGVVHRAVRDDDVFRKTVALKLVHGSAGLEHLRRLAEERRILARLDHPNIARILDGGTTEEGQPYLVMEYVEGQPIDVYCDARGLGIRARLETFRSVCGAVQHAHQNLVVHRDLKPANILVTADGEPKLLDFGIAKLLAAGVDPDHAPAATLLPMMTPQYASPEQLRGEPVTTASDVYSLGVVLYELLTGRGPFPVRTDSLQEIVRAVCETEPPLPSAALRGGPVRGTGPRASPAQLKGDLDTIVLKALQKDPRRRFGSVEQLSEDIRRHLEGRPVAARPDTIGYRAGKFMARHRIGVAAAALMAVALTVGIAAVVWEARVAEAHRARAERRFNDVRKLANTLLFEANGLIESLPGATAARELLLRTALQYLDSLATEAAGDPSLQAELATAYERMADVQGRPYAANLGDRAGALASYTKARQMREALVASDPSSVPYRRALAALDLKVADVLWASARTAEALRSLGLASASFEQLSREQPADSGIQAELGRALLRTGDLTDDPEAAIRWYRRALDVASNIHRGTSDEEVRRQLAQIHERIGNNLGNAEFSNLGDQAGALRHLREALAIRRTLTAGTDTPAMRALAVSYQNLGDVLLQAGTVSEAIDHQREALAIRERLAKADARDVLANAERAGSLHKVGSALAAAGRLQEALGLHRQGLAILIKLSRSDPEGTPLQRTLSIGYFTTAEVLARMGDLDNALTYYRHSVDIDEALARRKPGFLEFPASLAVSYARLGRTYVGIARRAESGLPEHLEGWRRAQASYRRSVEWWRRVAETDPGASDVVRRRRAALASDATRELARCDATIARLAKISSTVPPLMTAAAAPAARP